jgi:molecular chaperone DnaK
MSQKNSIFGIDLGTTYSCIAYMDEYGRPSVVTNADSDRTTPSVVLFSGDERIVGKEAKNSSKLEPGNVVDMVKRHMGKGTYKFEYEDNTYTAEEISSYVLKKIVQDAEQNTGLEIKDVVITCPAYFGIPERDATKKAGEIAGLNVLSIINEPTAAAISYGMNEEEAQKVLVYDLGGGTFDITAIQIEQGEIRVICTDGDHDLGGRNWDEVIVEYLAEQWQQEHGSDEDPLDSPETIQELYVLAEEAKKALTGREKKDISFMHNMKKVRIFLTREKFDELTNHLLEQTIGKTRSALAEAEKRGITIFDKILMVGGSTRMPQIARRLQEEFNQEPQFCDPDESVAKGAAIYGQKLMLGQKIIEIISQETGIKQENIDLEKIDGEILNKATETVAEDFGWELGAVKKAVETKITNVSSRSFGIQAFISETEEKICNLIFKNDPVPADVTHRFSTRFDNQVSVSLPVADNSSGEQYYDLPPTSREIGKTEIHLPPGLPKNSPIDVTFKLDEQGLLYMYAKELTSGRDVEITIQTENGITQEEFQNAKERSKALSFV